MTTVTCVHCAQIPIDERYCPMDHVVRDSDGQEIARYTDRDAAIGHWRKLAHAYITRGSVDVTPI